MGSILYGFASFLKVLFSNKPDYVEMRRETADYFTEKVQKPIANAAERISKGEPLIVRKEKPPVEWRPTWQILLIGCAITLALWLLQHVR